MTKVKDTTSKHVYTSLPKLPAADVGHNFKFSPVLQVYYCRCCRGVVAVLDYLNSVAYEI